MSDREIYSHSGSLASLVSDLKNGQRGIDSDSGDWVYKDYSGVIHAARSYKSYSGSVWNYNTLPTGLTGNRSLLTDASGNLAVSTVTSTELGYLSGVTSAIQTQLNGKLSGSGTTGRIPYFTAGSALGNSNLYFGGKSIRLMAAPSSWGASFAALEMGLNALWTNYTVQNGWVGFTFSNNIYHDGTGKKPHVDGLALSYSQDLGEHTWTSDQSLVAGTIFTPTERMRLDFNGLWLQSLNASSVVVNNSSGYLESSPVTPTELSYLSGVSSAIQTQLNGKLSASGLTANYLPMYNGSSLVNSVFQQSASMMSGIVGQFKFGNSSLNFINSGYTNTIAGWCCNAELKEVGGIPIYHSVVSGSVGILRNNGSNFEFCINTATSAGQQLAVDVKMGLSATGLFLSGLTANTVLVANASRYVTSSSVTPTELGYLSGVSSAIQTQLNGKISGSGITGLVPYFTSSGTVGATKFSYSPSLEQFMWYTSASSELMRLVDAYLWLNTKLVCNGISTGDTGYISMSTSTYTIDASTITQQNVKISSSVSTTLYIYKARVGTLIYLTNIGSNQLNVSYDNETGGPKYTLYPGQTMQLLCVNIYGAGSQSCTWAIWRTEVNASGHLDD